MKKRAIIVVDLQNEYLSDGRLPLVGIDDATSKAARVIDAARSRGEPVIHIRHENPGRDARLFVPGTPRGRDHSASESQAGRAGRRQALPKFVPPD